MKSLRAIYTLANHLGVPFHNHNRSYNKGKPYAAARSHRINLENGKHRIVTYPIGSNSRLPPHEQENRKRDADLRQAKRNKKRLFHTDLAIYGYHWKVMLLECELGKIHPTWRNKH